MQRLAIATSASARAHWPWLMLVPAFLAVWHYAQYALIYLPNLPPGSREVVDTPDLYNLPYTNVSLRTADGLRLAAYLIAPTNAAPVTVLFFHANAGNMGHRLPVVQRLIHSLGCRVFIFSYRGYGKSQGSPSEKGFRLDAQAALEFVRSAPETMGTSIIAYGQSIGGAVAIDTVSRFPEMFAAMIVENTFLSIPDLVPSVMPILRPLVFLCHQKWESKIRIKLIPTNLPVLFLSSANDELVPHAHMLELKRVLLTSGDGSREEQKNTMFQLFSVGTHNDAPAQPGYFEAIRVFVQKDVAKTDFQLPKPGAAIGFN